MAILHLHTSLRAGAGAWVLVLLAGCASGGKDIEGDIAVSLSPSLAPALAAHRPPVSLPAEIVEMDSTVAIDASGNFGVIRYSERHAAYQWESNGNLTTVVNAAFKSPNSNTRSITRETSLCGLIPLLRELRAAQDSTTTTAVPAGNVFLPLDVNSNTQLTSRYRVVGFTASVDNLCSPKRESSFSYRTEAEEQRRREGTLWSSNKLNRVVEVWNCSVGSGEKPASALNPALRGTYFDISCTRSEPDTPVRSSTYGYLLESGLYIPITVKWNASQTDTHRYTAVKFR